MKDDGHFIAIISSRAQPFFRDPYPVTERWLAQHDVPYDTLLVGTTDKKAQAIKNRLTAFVEDEDKYILQIAEIIPVLVMDQPWNHQLEGSNMVRVRDWDDVYENIQRLAV